MNTTVRAIIIFLCSGLFIFFAYNSATIYLKYPTAQSTTEKTLSQSAFPSVEICLSPGFDLEFLKFQGYNQLWLYVNGMSEKELIGWAGQGNLTTNELIKKAFTWKKSSDMLHAVIHEKPELHLDLEEIGVNYPEGNCFIISGVESKIEQSNNVNLDLVFKNISHDNEVSVWITDPYRRSWKRDVFSYSGIPIKKKIGPNAETTYDVYHIKVSETDELEQDEQAMCKDYSPLTDYGKCVEASTQQGYLDTLGCVPPWFGVKSSHQVCQNRLEVNFTYESGGQVPLAKMDVERVQVKR